MKVSLIAIFLFVLISINPCVATVWQATSDATLSEALSEAGQNDVVYLNPGTYTEAVSLTKKGLRLIGAGTDQVIFDLSGSNIRLRVENCVLQGVTVINSPKGVEVLAPGCEIRDCVFEGLTDNMGLYIIEDNILFCDNTVANCTGNYFAIYGMGNGCTYTGNTFINNSCAGLSLYQNSDSNIVSHNIFRDNKYGIYIWQAGGGNRIYLNDFTGNDEAVITNRPPSISWNSPDVINYTYNNTSYTGYLGNYWSGYNGSDIDDNGVFDAPYTVPASAGTDSYPLAAEFVNYTGAEETDPVDLVIVSLPDSLLVADQPNRIRVNISNNGSTDTGPFKVALYENNDSKLGEVIILSLGAGNSTQVAFTVLPPEAGINLTVVVDPEDYVEESIESNNEMTWSMSSETDETDENWFQFHKDAENTGFYPGDAPDDSTLLWVSDYINAVGSSSPVIGNGTVYVNCGESDMNSGPAGDDNDALLGLDMYTGEVVENFGPGSGSTSYGSWLAPCYYEGNVSCGRDDSVNGGDTIVNGKRYSSSYRGTYYCTYESNGTEIWSFQVRGNYAQGTPVYSDGMVYLTSSIYFNTVNGGDLYCVDADTGELIWHLNTPREMDGSVSVYNDVLYVTTYNWYSYGDIYAIDKYDGTVLWRNTIQRTDSCPAVAYGNVYVSGGCPGYSLIQSYCFDAVTGETVWETVASGYGIGGWTASPVVADDKVYIGQIDSTMFSYSKIYAFDAYTGDEIWSSSGGATPAISEGILYTIGNDYRVYAYGSLAPVANFSANVTSGEAPLTVAFTDLSGPNVTGWQWDFDNDGEIDSTEQNPVYTFSSAGNYTVSLKVTNSGGNDTETKDAFIVVTEDNGVQEDWNPWNDPDSDSGQYITIDEVMDAYNCWRMSIPASTGSSVSIDNVIDMYNAWRFSYPMV